MTFVQPTRATLHPVDDDDPADAAIIFSNEKHLFEPDYLSLFSSILEAEFRLADPRTEPILPVTSV